MKVLVADDDSVERRMLEGLLARWGYRVDAVADGARAEERLTGPEPPPLAILDWMMPGLTGLDVCRRVRERTSATPTYILMLTIKDSTDDIVAALGAGADDYVIKPFEGAELQARVEVGKRMVLLQRKLAERVVELERALSQVSRLQGLLPICTYCKKIRNEQNYWQQVEGYITDHSATKFSHGVCPDCFKRHVGPVIEEARQKVRRRQGPAA